MSRPLVSVVMPAYNAAPFIESAVQSVLSQTLGDIELLVVDDGSTDHTATRLAGVSDPRLRILRLTHQGVMVALNAGLAEARGEFFARMDADDLALPERLERQVRLLEEGGLDVTGSRVEIFRDKGPLGNGYHAYETWVNGLLDHDTIVRNIFIEDPIPSPTLMMRQETLRKLGGYDSGVYPDDYNLTLKSFCAGLRFGKCPETLLRWRDHDARLSRNAPELKNQRFFDLKSRYFTRAVPLVGRQIVIWGIGRNGKALFKALQKAGVEAAGFTAEARFIREKTLYERPVRRFQEWEGAFFLLATAAKKGREEAQAALHSADMTTPADFLPFC
ncbi:MAG: glycosyltransferase family 2 protein [Fibrobacterota bacterium]